MIVAILTDFNLKDCHDFDRPPLSWFSTSKTVMIFTPQLCHDFLPQRLSWFYPPALSWQSVPGKPEVQVPQRTRLQVQSWIIQVIESTYIFMPLYNCNVSSRMFCCDVVFQDLSKCHKGLGISDLLQFLFTRFSCCQEHSQLLPWKLFTDLVSDDIEKKK